MPKNSREIDPKDLGAKPAEKKPSISAMTGHSRPTLEIGRDVKVPDVFDEERIKQDLRNIANKPEIFAKYVARARSWFTKSNEVAVLEHWIRFFDTAKRLIESKTSFDYEHDTKIKEKEVKLASLDADLEEQLARRDEAAAKRQRINQFIGEPKISDDDRKRDAARDNRRRIIQWEVEERVEPKIISLEELDRWKKTRRRAVHRNEEITPDEREARLDDIDAAYEREKARILEDDIPIYKQESP